MAALGGIGGSSTSCRSTSGGGAAQRATPKVWYALSVLLGGRVGRAVCWVGAGVGGAWGELHPPSRLLGGVQARITRTFRGPAGPLWPQHTRFAACCCHSVVLPSVVAEQQEGAQGTCDNRRTLCVPAPPPAQGHAAPPAAAARCRREMPRATGWHCAAPPCLPVSGATSSLSRVARSVGCPASAAILSQATPR